MLSGNVTARISVTGNTPKSVPVYQVKDGNILLIDNIKVYADPVDENIKLAGAFPVSKYSFSLHLKENGITRADFTILDPSIKPPAYRKLVNTTKIAVRGTLTVEVFPKETIPDTDPLNITIEVIGHELPENHPLVRLYR